MAWQVGAGLSLMRNASSDYDSPVPSMDTRRVFAYVAAAAYLTGGRMDGIW